VWFKKISEYSKIWRIIAMLNAIFTDTTSASVLIAAPTTVTLTTGSVSTISTDVYPGGYVITLAAISPIRICTLRVSYYIIQFHSRKH
jgi:hypothetical protein